MQTISDRKFSIPLALTVLVACLVFSQVSFAQNIAPYYSGSYTYTSLGTAPGVPTLYGGMTLLAGNSNELLIGGGANGANGAIYEIGLTRGVGGHITGFSGSPTLFSTAPYIDGGLAYGPGGALFFTGYPVNTIGQIKPGSISPDRTDVLTGLGVQSSVGSLNFVPSGYPGAGEFKIASYSGGEFYNSTLTPDGFGTYNIGVATLTTTPLGGPEGFVYVPLGSALFPNPSMLLAQYGAGKVAACQLDADGNPIVASCQDFVQGLTGAEGGFVDPLTGDFLFSTFGGGNQIIEVSGFNAPTPEPGTLVLLGTGILGLAGTLRRKFNS
jgi:hypothetical protein